MPDAILKGWGAGWIAALLTALLLPPAAIASWLRGAYTATAGDVLAGAWILKAALAVLALAALAVARLPEPATATQTGTSPSPASRGQVAVMTAVVALALVLRAYRLDTELWLDELLVRLRYMPLEFGQLLSMYDSQNHQPLYTVLARVSWLTLGGTDWTVRIPALAFGVASIVAIWRFGRRVGPETEAILAAVILAVSYHHVWFSQNARGYTAILCLTIPATGAFLRLCNGAHRARREAWTYAVLMALATYTHLTAALIAAGHALALGVTTRWSSAQSARRVTWPAAALVLSALLTIVLYAPMLPQVVRDVTTPTMGGVSVEWTGAGWMLAEGFRVLATGVPGGLATAAVALVVLGTGLVSFWRQSRLATLLMLLPLVVTLVAVMAARHNLWPRFFFFGAGFIVLAAVRGGFTLVRWAVRWRPDAVAITGGAAVAMASLVTVPRAWEPKQQFRAAYDFVESERLPGDEVVAVDVAYHVYLMLGLGERWRFTTSPAMLAEAERSAPRTWVVYTLPARLRAVAPLLWERLSPSRYRVIRVFPATVGGGEIHVLRREATNPQ